MTQKCAYALPYSGTLRPLDARDATHLPYGTETRLGRREFIASVRQIERDDTRKHASNVAQCMRVLPGCW